MDTPSLPVPPRWDGEHAPRPAAGLGASEAPQPTAATPAPEAGFLDVPAVPGGADLPTEVIAAPDQVTQVIAASEQPTEVVALPEAEPHHEPTQVLPEVEPTLVMPDAARTPSYPTAPATPSRAWPAPVGPAAPGVPGPSAYPWQQPQMPPVADLGMPQAQRPIPPQAQQLPLPAQQLPPQAQQPVPPRPVPPMAPPAGAPAYPGAQAPAASLGAPSQGAAYPPAAYPGGGSSAAHAGAPSGQTAGQSGVAYPGAPNVAYPGTAQAGTPYATGQNAPYAPTGYQPVPGAAPQGYAPGYQGAPPYGPTYPPGPSYPSQGYPQAPTKKSPARTIMVVGLIVALALGGFFGLRGLLQPAPTPTPTPTPTKIVPSPKPTTAKPTPTTSTSTGGGTMNAPSAGIFLIESTLPDGVGMGTGMALTADGYILTNYHVIAGSKWVKATLADTGKSYNAAVIGCDPTKDVALLKLDGASGLPPVAIDQDPVTVGDAIVSLGNADGNMKLVAAEGTVTALNQDLEVASDSPWGQTESLSGLIKTNAGAVPGDSGGPMYDAEGEVLGMTTAGSTKRHTTYAVPVANALAIVNQILAGDESGTVRIGPAGYLGITPGDTYDATVGGIPVKDVAADSPAGKAGITTGCVITSFDGVPITQSTNLATLVRDTDPNQSVSIAWVDTGGGSHTATITMGTSTLN